MDRFKLPEIIPECDEVTKCMHFSKKIISGYYLPVKSIFKCRLLATCVCVNTVKPRNNLLTINNVGE